MSLRGPQGRSGFLKWINGEIGTNFSSIEQLSDGIGYMLLLDRYFVEENVPLDRLNLDATSFEQYMRNLNLLEKLFKKYEIPKRVPVETLAKGKLQDHMRFIQWLYQYLTKRFGTQKRSVQYNGVKKLTEINSRKRIKKLVPQLEDEIKRVLESMKDEYDPLNRLIKERDQLVEKLGKIKSLTDKYPRSKDSLFVKSIIRESVNHDEI